MNSPLIRSSPETHENDRMQANSQSSREYNYCFVSQDAYVWGFFLFGTDKDDDDDNIVQKKDQTVS